MGERPNLDLSAILGLYENVLPSREEAEAMRKVQQPDGGLRYDVPVRLGWGPDRWSTSMALVPVVPVCHDVNGYYRELGVDWRASRKELMQAYMAKDGQSSVRLTYVFKQLLDPLIREAYDKSPKGDFFLDDYTEASLKRRAAEEAGRRAQLNPDTTIQDVLDEWGYVLLDESDEGVDTVRGKRQDLPQRKAQGDWSYSYYAWQTEDFVQNEARLQEWQALLSTAAGRIGASTEIAIGVTSMVGLSDRSFMMEMVDDRPVLFFSTEAVPSPEIAEKAVTAFLEFADFSKFPSQ
jgi:hypothetical protein